MYASVLWPHSPTRSSKLANVEKGAKVFRVRMLYNRNNGIKMKHMCNRTSKTTRYSSTICLMLSAMKTTYTQQMPK